MLCPYFGQDRMLHNDKGRRPLSMSHCSVWLQAHTFEGVVRLNCVLLV